MAGIFRMGHFVLPIVFNGVFLPKQILMAIFSRLRKFENTALLIMRAGLGAMMIVHGFDKLKGGPAVWAELGHAMNALHIPYAYVFWGFMCAITETIGGLFCILGLWFRPVCLFMVFNFFVAAMFHYAKGDGPQESAHAIELIFVFFGLLFIGPGAFSVDRG